METIIAGGTAFPIIKFAVSNGFHRSIHSISTPPYERGGPMYMYQLTEQDERINTSGRRRRVG